MRVKDQVSTRSRLALFPGHLPFCSLDHICDLWTARSGSKVTYVVKRMEWEMAWEQG